MRNSNKFTLGEHNNAWKEQNITHARYLNLHASLRKKYGSANHCEKCFSPDKKQYQWALIHGRNYSDNPKDYMQMCRSCHTKYDYTKEQKSKNSILKKLQKPSYKPVHKIKNGKVIEAFISVTEAAIKHNVRRATLSGALTGKQKTCAGYEWKFANE